jgi:hypothetical protein
LSAGRRTVKRNRCHWQRDGVHDLAIAAAAPVRRHDPGRDRQLPPVGERAPAEQLGGEHARTLPGDRSQPHQLQRLVRRTRLGPCDQLVALGIQRTELPGRKRQPFALQDQIVL